MGRRCKKKDKAYTVSDLVKELKEQHDGTFMRFLLMSYYCPSLLECNKLEYIKSLLTNGPIGDYMMVINVNKNPLSFLIPYSEGVDEEGNMLISIEAFFSYFGVKV